MANTVVWFLSRVCALLGHPVSLELIFSGIFAIFIACTGWCFLGSIFNWCSRFSISTSLFVVGVLIGWVVVFLCFRIGSLFCVYFVYFLVLWLNFCYSWCSCFLVYQIARLFLCLWRVGLVCCVITCFGWLLIWCLGCGVVVGAMRHIVNAAG